MKRDAGVYLDDILEAITKIQQYYDGSSTGDSEISEMAMDAIVRNFEVVGEASKRIPQSIKQKHPEIPWKLMSGMRDKLIHEYFGINKQVLTETIKRDLPALKLQIEALLSQ